MTRYKRLEQGEWISIHRRLHRQLENVTGSPEPKLLAAEWNEICAATEELEDSAISDHGSLQGLGDDDHVQYLLVNGTRALTADWDIGDTRKILADEIRARDAAGLKLYDDGGNGIFVKDGTGIEFTSSGVLAMEITSGASPDVIVTDCLRVSNEITLQSDGSQTDPGFTWEDDPDTGLFRVGTDILGFATGGVERIRIDAAGNVGIDATPGGDGFPNDFTAGGRLLEIGDGSGDCGITLRSRTTAGNAFDIWQDYSGISLYIDSRRDSDTTGIIFRTKTNATPFEALIIMGDGLIDVPGVYNETEVGSANVLVAADGSLRRATSSRKVKKNINYGGVNPELALKFKPVSFDAKADGSHHLGLISEDCAEIDPRFSTGGDLPGLNLNAIVAALAATAQEQQKQIDGIRLELAI